MRLCSVVLISLSPVCLAAPYVAFIANVPVHSYSPDACIRVVDLATGEAVSVSEGLFSARSPAWAPDGSYLVFEAETGGQQDIFLCRPDGSERVNVTATPDQWESSPVALAADQVAYLSGPDCTAVVLRDLATGRARTLSEAECFHSGLTGNADGSLLGVVCSQRLAGPGHIHLLPGDGGTPRRLTTDAGLYSAPCFTDDGKAVLFAFDGPSIGGCTRGLARMALDGEPELLAEHGYPMAPVSVSADGAVIAYAAAPQYHTTWVHVIRDGKPEQVAVSPFHNTGWPSLSSDGRFLCYHGVYAARFTVHVVDLQTGEDRNLCPEGTGVNPVISPR